MNNINKIISYLGNSVPKAYTMHELSKLTSIPYATFYRTVQEIQDLLVIKLVGKSKTIQLNIQNPVIKSYLAVSSYEENKEFNQPIIRKINNELNTKDIVVLFGSYAKRTHNEKSDIDLMIINKDGSKSISFSKYELLYKKKINPIFVTKKEFEQMLMEKEENVSKQVLKYHIILNNYEGFWECVLNAVR